MPLCQLQRARTETYFAFVRHRRTVAAPVRHSNSPHGKSNASVHSNHGHGRPSTSCVRLLSCAASSASSYTTASTSKATTSAAGRVRPERRRVWTQISPLEVRSGHSVWRVASPPRTSTGKRAVDGDEGAVRAEFFCHRQLPTSSVVTKAWVCRRPQ